MLKIANIIEEGRYGGPQARIVAVAERLNRRGIETIVIFPSKDSDLFHRKLTSKGIQYRRLDLRRLTRQKVHLIKYFFFFMQEVFALVRVIKQENVDIVHCNSPRQIKGVIAGRLAGKKVVWVLNDTSSPRVVFWLFLLLSKCCNGSILTGKRVQNYYLITPRLRAIPHVIIRPPVDTGRFNPGNVINQQHNLLKRNGSNLNIVTIANVNPVKGLEYFIEMVHILNRNGKKANFFIVGPQFQSQRKYSMLLKGLINHYGIENIRFTGESYEIRQVLAETDIFVCSSVSESGPMTVWEAMSMRKAIVSTDVGDVARFIKDGENGFVVPIKDSAALAEKVGILIENEQLRKEFGRWAREIAIKHLDVGICARKHADFYKKVLQQGRVKAIST